MPGAHLLEDALPDDQAMHAFTPQGVVVLLGCCHAGVVNTLEYIVELTGGAPIHAVIGGPPCCGRIRSGSSTRQACWSFWGCNLIAPNHCTGLNAQCYLRTRFPERFHEAPAGRRFIFGVNP